MLPFYSSVMGPTEEQLLEQVLQFKLPLGTKTVDFGDLIKKVKVEFSYDKKYREEPVPDATALQSSIDDLNRKREKTEEEMSDVRRQMDEIIEHQKDDGSFLTDPGFMKLHGLYCNLENKISQLYMQIRTLERLRQGGPYRTSLLGEFSSSPSPTVTFYHNNGEPPFWQWLPAVFVHEMFHAWYYFEAGCQGRTMPEVDEPMVEFSTLYFLKQLAQSACSPADAMNIKRCLQWQENAVWRKQTAYGLTCAYGFGSYIYGTLASVTPDKSPHWIEAYSNKSASIRPSDTLPRKIADALTPLYPLDGEDSVLKSFEMLLFGKGAVTRKKSSPAMTFRDLLLACLKVLGKADFNLADIYRFKPVFETAYPGNAHIEAKIRQTLQQLESESILTRVTKGVYHIN